MEDFENKDKNYTKILFEMKNRINKINEKISKIESYGYNTNDLKNKLLDLQKSVDEIASTNEISDVIINLTFKNISSLESETEKINKYFSIFKDIDLIKKELNDDISTFKLKQIIYIIENDLGYFNNLKSLGYAYEKEKDAYKTIYEIIKTEFRKEGTSSLLKSILSNYNYIFNDLLELVNQDIEKYIKNPDIYKRFNEILAFNNIDEKMVYLLSFNENNYKENLFNELNETKNNYLETKKEYEKLKDSKNLESIYKDDIKDIKKTMNKAIITNSLYKIMAVLALFGIIKGSQVLKNNSKYHSTKIEVYDTLLPDTDSIEMYTTYDKNQVVVFDYKIPDNDDINIQINEYDFEYDGRNLEDYANLDFNNITPDRTNLRNNVILKDKEMEHTVVKLVNDVDYEDKFSSDGELIKGIGLSVLIQLEISLAVYSALHDLKVSDEDKYHLTPSVLSLLTKYPYKNIKLIIEDLKEISKLEENKGNGIIYNKENLKSLKEKLIELEKQYNDILNKYPNIDELLIYNDKNLELKLK